MFVSFKHRGYNASKDDAPNRRHIGFAYQQSLLEEGLFIDERERERESS
jgi:hypothetical protein